MQIGRHASGSVPREDFDAALSRIQALSERNPVLEARLDSLVTDPGKDENKNLPGPLRPNQQKRQKKPDRYRLAKNAWFFVKNHKSFGVLIY